MKKIMASVLAAAMIVGAGTATTFTGANTVITANAANTLQFTQYNSYVSVSGFNGTETEIEIPETYNNLPVTTIDENAFYNATNLTKITIPQSVKYINNYAFYNCSSLTEVNLPNTLLKIGNNAFEKCLSLEEISLPDSLNIIGDYAFSECAEMKKIVFPKGISNISKWVCKNCISLKEVVIENGASTIDRLSFEKCTSLTKVYIPLSISSIYNEWSYGYDLGAFTDCISLTDVYYSGSENQWNMLDEQSRSEFANATIHFEAKEIPEPLTPDVNRDGAIDASDASCILAYYAYTMTGGTGTIEEFLAK